MINLYIFDESSRATIYGIGTYIHELTFALKFDNINVCVIHLRSDNPNEEQPESDNIQHCFIPSPINQNNLLEWERQEELYYRNVVYFLRLQIKDTNGLIFHLNYNKSTTLADELKKAFVCRIVTVVHYSNWGFAFYDNLPRLRSILNEEKPDDNLKKSVENEKLYYSKADRLVCLSDYLYEILCRDYGLEATKISVIPNGLSDKLESKSNVNDLRKKWNVSLREKIILFAGRMDEVKGLTYLLKAFREILKIYSNCRLFIAGSGSFDKYTNESHDICTKITYTGFLDKSQLYECYQLSDVGVIPSLFEPFGYVAVEMMMHGLPIVATATSGLNEVVDDTCGVKVPLNILPDKVEIDEILLAEKILYLLQHPNEARKMGRNGRKRYLKEYSSEIFRKNMLNFYNSLYDS